MVNYTLSPVNISAVFTTNLIIYCIASNYGPDVYFFPATSNLATKQDWRLHETGVY